MRFEYSSGQEGRNALYVMSKYIKQIMNINHIFMSSWTMDWHCSMISCMYLLFQGCLPGLWSTAYIPENINTIDCSVFVDFIIIVSFKSTTSNINTKKISLQSKYNFARDIVFHFVPYINVIRCIWNHLKWRFFYRTFFQSTDCVSPG